MLGASASFASKAAPVRSADAPPPAHGPVDRAVARLEEVVDQETTALRARTAIDLKDFNNKKSQGLLELNRALRQLDGTPRDKAVLARLASLRAKLDTNRAILEVHLEAVREVATVMADAIRDAESDGTYSPSIRAGGSRL
jgi:hypothetical protein